MKPARMKKICQEIRLWINRRVRNAGASGVAIGVSGGVDSAVCLKLAAEALGATNVFAAWINVNSSTDDWKHAVLAARRAGVRLQDCNMNAVMLEVVGATHFVEHMTLANTRSRLRAVVLRGMANEHNLLVMGTTNATEMAIGYGTKGGDLDADMEPLAMFFKAEVYHIARYLGIPRSILDRPPSAGLWEGQTDEKELDMTYEAMDREVRRLGRPWATCEEHLADAIRVRNMNRKSAHKRLTPAFFVRDDEVKRALIIVDVQNDFCPGGALPVPEGDVIIPRINALMRYFPRIHCTADWHPKSHISFASSHEGKAIGDVIDTDYGQQRLWPDHCVKETEGARLHEKLWLGRMTRLHRKGVMHGSESYSAFLDVRGHSATDLHQVLQIEQVNEVCIVGLALDYCVLQTALDAKNLKYETHVVLSATRAVNVSPDDGVEAIRTLKEAGVVVHTNGKYLAENE